MNKIIFIISILSVICLCQCSCQSEIDMYHECIRINLNRLSEGDLFGALFLKVPGNYSTDTYYKTIDALRPFLKSKVWNKNITGYYIKIAEKSGRPVLQLSYFSTDLDSANATKKCLELFCSNPAYNISIEEKDAPGQTEVIKVLGGKELDCRKYLYLYPLIALDIMEDNLLNARCLMTTFRWQIMLARQSYKSHFEGTFKRSQVYRSLPSKQKDQFWDYLSAWPGEKEKKVDWAHMMCNMILAGDFIQLDVDYFLTKKPALGIEDINSLLKKINFGFQIPNGWQPL